MGIGRRICGVVFGALAALALGSLAHATTSEAANALQSITPTDGQTLAQSPTEIVLAFQQELDNEDLATIELTCDGTRQDTGLGERNDDDTAVSFAIRSELPRGPCIVEWRLVDGLGATITNATTTFSVQADPSTSTAPDAATTTTTIPDGGEIVEVPVTEPPAGSDADEGSSGGALWLGRILSSIGILVVFGALALIGIGWPEGPEYIVTVRFLRTAWAVGLGGTILFVVALTADATGSTFSSALSPAAWLDLMDAGWSGRGALLRLALVAGSGAFALRPERIIDPTSQMWAWGVPAGAVCTLALSRADESGALIGVTVGVAHALAAAVWFGGVALVARVVLAGPGDEDLVQATRAFSRLSTPAIAVTCVTGVIEMIRLDGGELFSSGHGRVVLLKVIAVAVMIAVGVAIRQQVGLRLERAHELSSGNADRFRRAFGAEATLGVVVLAFSGWLLALTPPNADVLAGENYVARIAILDAGVGLDADLELGPGRVGGNGFKLTINTPTTGVSGVKLTFTPPAGAPAGSDSLIVQNIGGLTGTGTAYLLSDPGLPLNVAGTWTVEFAANLPTGPIVRVGHFEVAGDGDTVVSQPAPQVTADVNVSVVEPPPNTADFVTNPPLASPTPTPTP